MRDDIWVLDSFFSFGFSFSFSFSFRVFLQGFLLSLHIHNTPPAVAVDLTSGYATWFTAGGAIRIAHYDVIDDVITRKL